MAFRALALSLVLAVGWSSASRAADPTAPSIAVTDAWSRATPPSVTTAALYFTITDSGAPDSLVSVSTPIAASATAHQSQTVNGMMQMRPVDSVLVDSHAPVKFAPNGYHVMLEGLKQPLKAGDHFPVTLNFTHAGAVTTTVTVQALGAEPKPMGGMDMGHM
jgi:copper(I)-binding protein